MNGYFRDPGGIVSSLPGKRLFSDFESLLGIISPMTGTLVEISTIHALADRVLGWLRRGDRQKTILSLSYLLGQELTSEEINRIVLRVVGNAGRYRQGEALNSWSTQRSREWVLTKITKVESVIGDDKKTKLSIKSLIYTGEPAGELTVENKSFNFFSFMARFRNEKKVGSGFEKSRFNSVGEQRSKRLYYKPVQFTGLLVIREVKKGNLDGLPWLGELDYNSMTLSHNKDLISKRLRKCSPCIKSASFSRDCHNCAANLAQCELSVSHAQ